MNKLPRHQMPNPDCAYKMFTDRCDGEAIAKVYSAGGVPHYRCAQCISAAFEYLTKIEYFDVPERKAQDHAEATVLIDWKGEDTGVTEFTFTDADSVQLAMKVAEFADAVLQCGQVDTITISVNFQYRG